MDPIAAICAQFEIPAPLVTAAPYGAGHIHDTYLVEGANRSRYILQRLNRHVFPRPQDVMYNLRLICDHLSKNYEDPARCVPRPVLALSGKDHVIDDRGAFWRAFEFLEGSEARLQLDSAPQAFELGRAFGEFDRLLADLPAGLRQTIPRFHDTPHRFEQLDASLAGDPMNRASEAGPQIDFAAHRRDRAGRVQALLESGDLPLRPAHNDAKVSNLLFDAQTGDGLCVIDLDTVMPGTWLFDFGELVRSGVGEGGEDAASQGPARISLARFEALARGFLAGTGGMLEPAERELLVYAGQLMALENGVRFLSDFLLGDRYYKTSRPGQNLDRCRAQFALVEALEMAQDRMWAIVKRE